jgi:hypothetical protein
MIRNILLFMGAALLAAAPASAQKPLTVEPGIQHGTLIIFPVVAPATAGTQKFLTLDEGVGSGAVSVRESGGGEVNRLQLVNDSGRPLLLLAGEIVTGGKQDRIVGVDRIVPPHSGPIDLSVFCVEPGRWTSESNQFGSMKLQMAGPSVREPAMAAKDQQQVWDRTRAAVSETVEVASSSPEVSTSGGSIAGGIVARNAAPKTSSYARAMSAPMVQAQVNKIADNYDSVLAQLRRQHARGVVVAIGGRIVWADIFASDDLLARYWQKLVRSYASDALINSAWTGSVDREDAQRFLNQMAGEQEISDTKEGLYRSTEITGPGFKVFQLTSLLSSPTYVVHTAKIARGDSGMKPTTVGRMIRR